MTGRTEPSSRWMEALLEPARLEGLRRWFRGLGRREDEMTDEYEFQAVYRGYTHADSVQGAHELVGKHLDLEDPCLYDLVIHKLDGHDKAQRDMFEARLVAQGECER